MLADIINSAKTWHALPNSRVSEQLFTQKSWKSIRTGAFSCKNANAATGWKAERRNTVCVCLKGTMGPNKIKCFQIWHKGLPFDPVNWKQFWILTHQRFPKSSETKQLYHKGSSNLMLFLTEVVMVKGFCLHHNEIWCLPRFWIPYFSSANLKKLKRYQQNLTYMQFFLQIVSKL